MPKITQIQYNALPKRADISKTVVSGMKDIKAPRQDYMVDGGWYGGVALVGNERSLQQDRLLAEVFPDDMDANWKSLSETQQASVLRNTFAELDRIILEDSINQYSGSTAIVAIFNADERTVTYACAGDSELLEITHSNGVFQTCKRLNPIHNAAQPDELARLKAKPFPDPCGSDLATGLGVSRSFGDGSDRAYGLISEPDVKTFNFPEGDGYYAVASDGLWAFEEVTADNFQRFGQDVTDSRHLPIDEQAHHCAEKCIEGGSKDNVSLQLYQFQQQPQPGKIQILAIFDGHGREPSPSIFLAQNFVAVLKLELAKQVKLNLETPSTNITLPLPTPEASSPPSSAYKPIPPITFNFAKLLELQQSAVGQSSAESVTTTGGLKPVDKNRKPGF